jgi:hypothetical protein
VSHYHWERSHLIRSWVEEWVQSGPDEIDRGEEAEVAEESRWVKGGYRRPSLMRLPLWVGVEVEEVYDVTFTYPRI